MWHKLCIGTFLSQFIPLVCLIQGIFCKYVSPRLELILNQLIKVKCKLVIGFLVDAGPAKLPPSGDTFNFCGFLLICATDKVSGVPIADYVFSQVNSIEGCLISTTASVSNAEALRDYWKTICTLYKELCV